MTKIKCSGQDWCACANLLMDFWPRMASEIYHSGTYIWNMWSIIQTCIFQICDVEINGNSVVMCSCSTRIEDALIILSRDLWRVQNGKTWLLGFELIHLTNPCFFACDKNGHYRETWQKFGNPKIGDKKSAHQARFPSSPINRSPDLVFSDYCQIWIIRTHRNSSESPNSVIRVTRITEYLVIRLFGWPK
jgi:hypothetical protein